MILTVDDKDLYFPDIDLSGNALASVIQQSQMLLESKLGAGRSLEITKYVENRELFSTGTIQLTYVPLVVDPIYPIQVSIRYFDQDVRFNRIHRANDWEPLTEDDFTYDLELGEIRLHTQFSNLTHFAPSGQSYRVRRVLSRPQTPQLRISYYSGFDFTSDSYAVREIKQALGNIVSFKGSDVNGLIASGISSYEIDDFYKIGFGANNNRAGLAANKASVIDENLSVVYRYRPREYMR